MSTKKIKDSAVLRPLHDRLLVQREGAVLSSLGAIVVSDSDGERSQRGEVVAVGPGRVQASGGLRPLGIKVGDRVRFGKLVGIEVKVSGKPLVMLRETDVVSVA